MFALEDRPASLTLPSTTSISINHHHHHHHGVSNDHLHKPSLVVDAADMASSTPYKPPTTSSTTTNNSDNVVHPEEPAPPSGTNNPVFIKEPRDLDILCGKEKVCINHVGSRRFRAVIESYRARYQAAPSKYEKMGITKEICDRLHASSSRFLKYNTDANAWEIIPAVVARDKVGHALRHANRDKRRKSRKLRGDGSTMSGSSSVTGSMASGSTSPTTCTASTSGGGHASHSASVVTSSSSSRQQRAPTTMNPSYATTSTTTSSSADHPPSSASMMMMMNMMRPPAPVPSSSLASTAHLEQPTPILASSIPVPSTTTGSSSMGLLGSIEEDIIRLFRAEANVGSEPSSWQPQTSTTSTTDTTTTTSATNHFLFQSSMQQQQPQQQPQQQQSGVAQGNGSLQDLQNAGLHDPILEGALEGIFEA